MQARVVGEDAVLVECADLEEMQSVYAAALSRVQQLAARDIVPAARTVLIDGVADPADLARRIPGWTPPTAGNGGRLWGNAPEDVVDVPVTYDGPDLATVARRWGVEPPEVGALHATCEFVVAFCGFAPGFAYLSGLPEARAVPRLSEPRREVPAGSVGLAGALTGIYPRASPGGWQLIGHTDLELWRPEADPPALLTPGTRVRFVDG